MSYVFLSEMSNNIVTMRIVLVLFVFLFQGGLGDLIVQVQNGKVQGTSYGTPSGRTFYTWRGIPYGKPPLGNLRYLPPLKAEPWADILDASEDSPACVAFGGTNVPTNGYSEDCLYLSVYSPVAVGSNSSVNATLPVLFSIYGGAFFTGNVDFASHDPTPFLEDNVIVVSANYRVGFFGFLSTGDDVILGNAGLKDQVLALQWIQDNIAFFGGNPDEVTIFGDSAGGASVGYHIVSPKSRNLFKRGIIESGTALVAQLIQSNVTEIAFTLASQVSSSITNASTSAEVLEVLQAAPADLLVNLTVGNRVTTVIEVESDFSFLTRPIYETLESGDFARVPIIIGHNSEEFLFATHDLANLTRLANQTDLDLRTLVPDMRLNENVSAVAVGAEIHERYIGKDQLFSNNLAAFLHFASVKQLVRSNYKYATLQSKYTPVYFYQFSYYGAMSKTNLIVPGAGKVGHADQVGYLFNISGNPLETELDYLTRRRFVKLFTNFAKTSNPTPDDDSAELLQNVKWEPLTEDNNQYLDIDENLQIKPHEYANETIFWDHIWESYAQRPYNTY